MIRTYANGAPATTTRRSETKTFGRGSANGAPSVPPIEKAGRQSRRACKRTAHHGPFRFSQTHADCRSL